ncbi:putative c-x8-c-x5-c-x3-h type zinc finger protein [Golovinomyces cichoracearum]|uniref:Putative c-x8-c-x5-c-x3-h type zinc finger protein n=1 Tax=Golovinomyces cichoracearum TaxID=62708 RepID=A0A420HBE5_9PEZI|nr:putative c-x8-c-x5-c-x3-h type zinc finger protein [Golovinomyces cichoracearum]
MIETMSTSEYTAGQDYHKDSYRSDFAHEHGIYDLRNNSHVNGNKRSKFIPTTLSDVPHMSRKFDMHYTEPLCVRQRAQRRNDGPLTGSIPLSSIRPGAISPSEAQLDLAFAYGIRRSDGRVTRLVRADFLNTPYMNPQIPPWQPEEGLIVLPEPRQLSPDRRQGYDPLITQQSACDLNHPVITNLSRTSGQDQNLTQLQIDTIVNTGLNNGVTVAPRRRQKIYCDKWVHEGVCAFTQIGCKFKHEMPSDKATQISLGLNHGYPSWYRRACAQKFRTCPEISLDTSHQRAIEDNWRRQSSIRHNALRFSQNLSAAQESGQPNFTSVRPVPSRFTYQDNTNSPPFDPNAKPENFKSQKTINL